MKINCDRLHMAFPFSIQKIPKSLAKRTNTSFIAGLGLAGLEAVLTRQAAGVRVSSGDVWARRMGSFSIRCRLQQVNCQVADPGKFPTSNRITEMRTLPNIFQLVSL
jgi:hypothetical protein